MAGKSLNRAQLIGHLGKDPELRYTANGMAVATVNIATNEYDGKNEDGTSKERTEWHRIVFWGKLAEIADQYCRKGRQIYVEGRLQTRAWDDEKTGIKRYTTEVVVDSFGGALLLLGGKDDSSGGKRPPHPADTYSTDSTVATPRADEVHDTLPPAPDAPEEEIPF